MIKNIIFDLGNVVFKFNLNNVLNRYTEDDQIKALLTEVIFDSQEWKDLDQGIIEKDKALGIMLSKLPIYLHDACKGIMQEWCDILEINYDIIDLITKLRNNGYKTYVLSNAPHDIPPFLTYKDLNKYFDGQIISAQEKISKPDAKIYEILLNRFNLKPNESIFFDDKAENIEAAIAAKINGVVYDYNHHEQLLEELDKYDVNYR